VSAKRGIKNPLSVAETSSIADAFGAAPVVLIPTFCADDLFKTTTNIIKNIVQKRFLFFIKYYL
jgi:hypothetical protein